MSDLYLNTLKFQCDNANNFSLTLFIALLVSIIVKITIIYLFNYQLVILMLTRKITHQKDQKRGSELVLTN